MFHLFESRKTPFSFILFDVAEAVLNDRPVDYFALDGKGSDVYAEISGGRAASRVGARRSGASLAQALRVGRDPDLRHQPRAQPRAPGLDGGRTRARRRRRRLSCAPSTGDASARAATPARSTARPILSKAEAALILSHRKAWRALLASGAAHAVVLEDDVHLGRGFRDDARPRLEPLRLRRRQAGNLMLYKVWLSRRGEPAGERRLHRLGAEHLGAAAYVISRAGARKMLAATRRLTAHVDQTLFGRHDDRRRRDQGAPTRSGDRGAGQSSARRGRPRELAHHSARRGPQAPRRAGPTRKTARTGAMAARGAASGRSDQPLDEAGADDASPARSMGVNGSVGGRER